MPETPWLTLDEAIDYTKFRRTKVITALERGDLRGYQTARNAPWRIHRDDLDAYLRGEVPVAVAPAITRRRRTA